MKNILTFKSSIKDSKHQKMTDTNIKDAAKKIFNETIKDKLSVKLEPKDENHLKIVIEDAIKIGINAR